MRQKSKAPSRAQMARMRAATNAQRLLVRRIERAFERKVGGIARAFRKRVEALLDRYLITKIHEDDFKPSDKKRADDIDRELDVLYTEFFALTKPMLDKVVAAMGRDVMKVVVAQNKVMGITPSMFGKNGEALIYKTRQNMAELIGKNSRRYTGNIKEIFANPENMGLHVEGLKDLIMRASNASESHAELIARDQTLKLHGAIVKEQQTSSGITSYVWMTSHDDRVRDTHEELDGQEFDWTNPPEPGNPGDDFQCRCSAIPVLPYYLQTAAEDG